MPHATTSAVVTVKGEEHFVHQGEVLPASHPAVKAAPELFEPEPKATGTRGTGSRAKASK